MSIQRCYAVILFTDLCSSTSLCENIDAEFYAEIIAQIRSICEEVIDQHKGILNQFYGDGVLAAFGFPTPREDAIYQATTAALTLHQRVRAAKRHAKLPVNFEMKMHSGIDAGYIVADTGDHIQGRYKFAGNALNIASRLSGIAGEDEILVSHETLRHELPFFITERIDNIQLKGKEKRISAYKVTGTSPIRNRFHAREQMGLSPFVGRNEALKTLSKSLLRARQGKYSQVNIFGAAGIGKSRLVQHFFLLGHSSNCLVFQTFCVENRPSLPLHQLVRSIFAIDKNANYQDISEAVSSTLKELKQHTTSLHKQLVDFLCSDSPADLTKQVYPLFFSRNLATIISTLAKRKTIILAIDDFQFSDNQTRLNITSLAQQLQTSRVLIITCSRAEAKPNFPSMGAKLPLTPFKATEAKSLIRYLLPRETSEKKIHSIFTFCGGNPLYTEETCKVLSQNPLKNPQIEIEPYDKFCVKMKSQLSPKILWLIAQRLRLLPEKLLKAIDCAAIIGQLMEKSSLEKLCGHRITPSDINTLEQSGLISRTQKNEQLLAFSGGSTHAAIYQTIQLSRRQYLHAKYATILKKKRHSKKQTNVWECLASHYEKAENRIEAGKYFAIAAEKALASSNYELTRSYYSSAIKNIELDNHKDKNYSQWLTLLFRLTRAYLFDASPEILPHLQKGLQLSNHRADKKSYLMCQLWWCNINYALGRANQIIEQCSTLLQDLQKLGNDELADKTRCLLAQACVSISDYPQALQLLNTINNHHLAKGEKGTVPAYSLACHAFALADKGEFEQADIRFIEAIHLVENSQSDVLGSIFVLFAAAKLWQGKWQEARDLAEQSKNHAQRTVSNYVFATASAVSAYAEWKTSQNNALKSTILDAAQWLQQQGRHLFLSLPYAWLCEISLQTGDIEKTRLYAAHVLRRARVKDHLGEALAYRCLADIYGNRQGNKPLKNNDLSKKYLRLALESARKKQSIREEGEAKQLATRLGFELK